MDYKQKFIKSFLAASRRAKPVKGLLKPTTWTSAHDDLLADLDFSKRGAKNIRLKTAMTGLARKMRLKRPRNFT